MLTTFPIESNDKTKNLYNHGRSKSLVTVIEPTRIPIAMPIAMKAM